MAARKPREPKPKKLSATQKVKLLTGILKEVQRAHYHEPDSDAMELCVGCGRSPYNVPPHSETCLVVRVKNALDTVLAGVKCIHCGASVTQRRDWCCRHDV